MLLNYITLTINHDGIANLKGGDTIGAIQSAWSFKKYATFSGKILLECGN